MEFLQPRSLEEALAAKAERPEAVPIAGLALDAGPTTTALSGARQELLDALRRALDAALSAGATTVEVKLEAPGTLARTSSERAGRRERVPRETSRSGRPVRPRQPPSSPLASSAASRSTRARSSPLSVSSSQVASTPSSAIATMSSQR